MKTFNYKNETYSCEVVHKNTNVDAKSKCVRIITPSGIRNIYTIADGYTKPVAYCRNTIVLSDIIVGKAFAILGLMINGKKFVFTPDTVTTKIVEATKPSSVVASNIVSNLTLMYRVIDINTGSIAMFSSETDVVSYCIGRTVKVDKVDISTDIENTVIPDISDDVIDNIDEDVIPTVTDDTDIPKRRAKTDYTKPISSEEDSSVSPITPAVPIDITHINAAIIKNTPPRRRRKA